MLDRHVLPLAVLDDEREPVLFSGPANTEPPATDGRSMADPDSPWQLLAPSAPDAPPSDL